MIIRGRFFAALLSSSLFFFSPLVASALSYADNELIELGREQISVPSEIDLDFDELTRFVWALFEHRNVLSEITARLAVGVEDRVDLIEEMTERNEKVFSKYNLSAERVAILERVLFEIPEMMDYIELIAMDLPRDIRSNAKIPSSYDEVIKRLDGVVTYNVKAAIEEQMSLNTGTSNNNSSTWFNN
ncbi:hypothetical protein [Marinobacter alkaliphilus]|uniref:Uncharacterized protein n=1 Tax=Marinobacter alkaliphilus TaxID=254719 RepID=A0ABZ3EAD0_9GAMM